MTSATQTRTIAAPVEAVWTVLADLGAISAWAPDVDHSCRLDEGPAGPGTARRVQVGRLALVERVMAWEPPTCLAYRVEGLPALLGTVTNTWELRPEGARTAVALTSTVDAGVRPPGPLVARIALRRLARTATAMLAGLDRHLATEVAR